jgi:hypothetical protein
MTFKSVTTLGQANVAVDSQVLLEDISATDLAIANEDR